MEELIENIRIIHYSIAPDIVFIPEIAFITYMESSKALNKLKGYLEFDYFKSLDMFGDERDLIKHKHLYALAKNQGLITKAHIGEFSDFTNIVIIQMWIIQKILTEFCMTLLVRLNSK